MAGAPGRFGHGVIEYDRDGRYMKRIALNERGDTLGTTRCRRENGEMVEEVFYSPDDKQIGRTMYERMSGEEVQFEVWEGERLHYEGANFYDARERIEKQLGVENDMEVINYFEYEKNLLVKSYQEDISGRRTYTQQFEYTAFDTQGNWTLKMVYPGKEKIVPEIVVTRKYTYY